MLDHFSPGPLNLADIEVFLTTCNYDDLYRSDLHLVGACFDDRMFYTFGFSASKWDLPLFGKSYIAGSGLRTFLDLFGRYDPHDLPVPPNPFSVALAKSLFVAGTLVGSEIYSTQALTVHFFGGFYELMLRLQSGFTKMGDVLYTFWLFNPLPDTADEFRLRLLLLVKIDYEHDILVSRRIELHYHQDGPPSKKDAVHFVSPIYRDVTEEELKGMRPPTVNATHFCHLIFVQIDNEWNFLVIPEVSPIKKSIVIEEEGDGTQRLQFSSAFINRVAQDIIASKRRNDQRHTR
jgi:hypothetical protein